MELKYKNHFSYSWILVPLTLGFYSYVSNINLPDLDETALIREQPNLESLEIILKNNNIIPSSYSYLFLFDEMDCSMCLDQQLLLIRSLKLQKKVLIVGFFMSERNFKVFEYANRNFEVRQLPLDILGDTKQVLRFPAYIKLNEENKISAVLEVSDNLDEIVFFLSVY